VAILDVNLTSVWYRYSRTLYLSSGWCANSCADLCRDL